MIGHEARPALASGVWSGTSFAVPGKPPVYIDALGRVSSLPPGTTATDPGTGSGVWSGTSFAVPGKPPVYIDAFGRVSSFPPGGPLARSIADGATPSVANFHQAGSAACLPPTPASTGATSPSAQLAGNGAPATLEPAAGIQGSPVPAPEPTSIVSAVALAGFLVLVRRARSGRLDQQSSPT